MADCDFNWDFVVPKPPHGPALYWRHKWKEYQLNPGLPKTKGTMQNLDSMGQGPKAVVVNGKVAYLRDDLVEWLNTLPVTTPTKGRVGSAA